MRLVICFLVVACFAVSAGAESAGKRGDATQPAAGAGDVRGATKPAAPATRPTGTAGPTEGAEPAAAAHRDGNDTRLAVPDADAIGRAQKVVHNVYRQDFTRAKRPEEKATFAKKLLTAGGQTANDAGGRYVLLTTARDLALEGGAVDTALAAVDATAQWYSVDAWSQKADALGRLLRTIKPSDAKAIATAASAVLDAAVAEDRYDVAGRVGDVLLAAARRTGEPNATANAAARVHDAREAEAAFTEVREAFTAFEKDDSDPDANLKIGRFRCFVKGNWSDGLPMLARGSDAALKALATQELALATGAGATPPAEQQLRLADGWWDCAGQQKTGSRPIRLHAAEIYRKVLPSLTGLAKDQAEQRIAQAPPPAPAPATPAAAPAPGTASANARGKTAGVPNTAPRGQQQPQQGDYPKRAIPHTLPPVEVPNIGLGN